MNGANCRGTEGLESEVAVGDAVERIGRRPIETECFRGHCPVDGEGCSGQSGGTKRRFIEAGFCVAKSQTVAPKHLHIGEKMMPECHGSGLAARWGEGSKKHLAWNDAEPGRVLWEEPHLHSDGPDSVTACYDGNELTGYTVTSPNGKRRVYGDPNAGFRRYDFDPPITSGGSAKSRDATPARTSPSAARRGTSKTCYGYGN